MKRIMIFGDSHVAGAELADPKYFPDFPGYLPYDRMETGDPEYHQWFLKSMDRRYHLGLDTTIWRDEKELAFPAKIQSVLGVPTLNYGESGSSQHRINLNVMHRVQQSLNEGLAPQEIYVAVLLTSSNRVLHFSEGYKRDLILGSHQTKRKFDNDDIRELDALYVKHWSEEFIQDLHATHVLSCVSFLKTKGVKFDLLDGRNVRHTAHYLTTSECPAYVSQAWKTTLQLCGYQGFQDIPSMHELAIEEKVQEAVVSGFHFSKDVHDRFALRVAKLAIS